MLPRIALPTLFIGAKSSQVPHTCAAWEAAQVPGAQLSIFSESELGSHFMFVENPAKFNAVLAGFIG